LKRVLSPEQTPLALPVSAEIGGPLVPQMQNGTAAQPQENADQEPPPPQLPGWIRDARSQGAAQAATMKTVGSLVQDNPKQAALIVRDWLSSAV
jgi:flagellar M-ring protein FliF